MESSLVSLISEMSISFLQFTFKLLGFIDNKEKKLVIKVVNYNHPLYNLAKLCPNLKQKAPQKKDLKSQQEAK